MASQYASSTTTQNRDNDALDPDLETQRNKEEPQAESSRLSDVQFPVTDLDAGIVAWDGQDDPENPQNFSPRKKWMILALISVMTIISPLASSMFAPAVGYMAREFGETNETVTSLSVSIYLIGYTVGPLLLAPLSEIYGRRVVLSAGNWFFVVWQIGCALARNTETLIVCRLLAGIGGSACLTLGAGVIADLFGVQQRGRATALWAMGPLIGPVAGPIAGGFLGEAAGWRWVFWLLLIAGGVLSLVVDLVNRETYAPVLLRRKAAALAKELNRGDLRSALEPGDADVSAARTIRKGVLRPLRLLSQSVIVLLLSVYMALVYGLLYLFFTTITSVFTTQYGFSTGLAGLAYLGIGMGFLVGLVIIGSTNDGMVMKLAARNGGKMEPEMRLPMMTIFACILPISFFWYGWTADKHVHWIVPIIGMFPFGTGMMGVFMPVQTYVIDCYPKYAASGNAALTATRSLLGALLPLAGPAMFKSLGLGWGNSLLGFLALAFVPLPIVFIRYGKAIRERWPVNLD
ncbi:Major facilitator superfamily domain, general substrate transporter [Cordyceps fumosorosea ARSEF 2679]|uniref:Major facilitator superfamily domain, general substrate transporter n=1 Tax=Cordyceps fumosorosea (strain ARSEF 2679) TaxID=1081104 RepID=A0A162MA58_CORFA|nr:Major facilitator superfamily domain, general substrate transporter [Cordyceps fumosorosea ARSEF 2679]OAA53230.1 Major facilitator superfamily domain, general substrate transporter [Cordyceps fumosorosea ARSEF 2679]